MYKKKVISKFTKDGYNLEIPDIDYKNISISFVSIENERKTYCKIKNSPIYYYIIEGNGIFNISDKITVNRGDFIEISPNKKFTYSGNMKMLEIIPRSFEELEVIEEIIR